MRADLIRALAASLQSAAAILMEMANEAEPQQTMVDLSTLSMRALKALDRLGVKTLDDLSKVSRYDLSRIKGCGLQAIEEIAEQAEKQGIRLRGEGSNQMK